MTYRWMVLAVMLAACGGKERGTQPPAPSPPAPTPVAASGFPALETRCVTDEDCTYTGRWSTCCGVCEQRYASKAYVAKVDAYCEANPPAQCPPSGCSWGMATVHCVEGVCRDRPPQAPVLKVREPLPPKQP